MWKLHRRRTIAAVVVAGVLGAESTCAFARFVPLNNVIVVADMNGIKRRRLTRVLLRAAEGVSEQQQVAPDSLPVALRTRGNTRPALPDSYPLLLVSAGDFSVPPDSAALATNSDLPLNLVTPQVLLPVLSRMWKLSPTFRRQCRRIAAEPRLLVRVYIAASASESRGRAATHVDRHSTGLDAAVYVAGRATSTGFIELIAHEFEHIVEQLDGLDLPRLARLAPDTVWTTGDQAFETQRAMAMGRMVAREVEGRER